MTPASTALVCLVATGIAAGAAAAQESEHVRIAIAGDYERISRALADKDAAGFAAFYAPDARIVGIDALDQSAADAIADLKRALEPMREFSVRVTVTNLALDGNGATVIAEFAWKGMHAEFGTQDHIRIAQKSRDSWTKTDRGWRIRRSEMLRERIWLNDALLSDREVQPPLSADERSAIVRDVTAQAMRFDTVVAGSGFDDLAWVNEVIGDAPIVSLGEATHGTAEFFQMKHRLLEYLVERKGFTVFAIESNWPETQAVDRYVRTGEGDGTATVRAMYRVWHTEEIRAMVAWMRAYNKRRGGRPAISFTGFDLQQTSAAKRCAADLFGRLGSADAETINRLYEGVERLDRQLTAPVPPADKVELRDRATAALALFDARRNALANVLRPEEDRDARQCARILQQATDLAVTNSSTDRDRMMAENVRWLAEDAYPHQKIVLWAHNGHVAPRPVGRVKSMGNYLRETFAGDMVVIGFASERGDVRARLIKDGKASSDWMSIRLNDAPADSVETLFAQTLVPRFMLDFRRVPPDGALARWLAAPRLHRAVGWGYNPDEKLFGYDHVALPGAYDGIVFIAQSTAARPLE